MIRQQVSPIVSRRGFLQTGAAVGLLGLGQSGIASAAASGDPKADETVHFLFDGLHLTSSECSRLLERLASEGRAKEDTYMSGGAVADLESAFAKALGKEKAVFVATGTLANHLAIRTLAKDASRVIVPADSHIYNDSSDCVETLSHINLVPIGRGKPTFTVAEVREAVRQAADGPFPLRVGAITIECPVRRLDGAVFDYEEMKRVSEYARAHAIGMHLDGARLYIASAYTGVSPAEYAALFDTVYISLYKYFNAAGGAILAGSKAAVNAVAHARKLFGAGLFQAWPQAAVALHYLDGFGERYQKAVATAKALFAELQKDSRFRVEGYPGGTNIFKLHVDGADPKRYTAELKSRGILIRRAQRNAPDFLLFVNESLNRRPADQLARAFMYALGG